MGFPNSLLTKGHSQTLPILVTPDNRVIGDSMEILQYLHDEGMLLLE